MPIDARIPMMGNSLDTATPIYQAQHQQNENQLAAAQTLKAHYEALDQREKSRLVSTIAGAAQLKTYLDADDKEGAARFLSQRKSQLMQRMGHGENIDTQETDYAMSLLKAGKIDELKHGVTSLMAAGQVYGLFGDNNTPADIQTAEWYRTASPEQQKAFDTTKRAPTVINLGNEQQVLRGSQPNQSYNVGVSPNESPENKGAQQTAVLGAQKQANYGKASAALQGLKQQASVVDQAIVEAQKLSSGWSTGYGNMVFGGLPNTDARALNNALDTIKANLGFDKLQAMREASVTGGALGNVSDFENRLLQAVNGALDPKQSDQLAKHLADIKELYPKVVQEKEAAFARDYGDGQQAAPAGGSQKIRVVNQKTGESFDIDASDLPAAQQEGFIRQ